MRFDWEQFLRSEFPKGKIIKGNNKKELNIDCISPDCPNPHGHMFVNIESEIPKHHRRFFCHRCGLRGNYKAFLINYFRLPLDEILENISDIHGIDEDSYASTKLHIKNFFKNTLSLSDDIDKEEGFIIELPRESQRLSKSIKFCKQREVPFEIFKKFKASICKSGFYTNRIIFPITTNNNSCFLAYSQLSKKSIKQWKKLSKENPNNKLFKKNSRKVLYPLGSLINLLLFNYNNIRKNEDIIFIVEGVFDCIRILLHGYVAVAYLKGFVSEYQAQLLSDKNPKEICFVPDSDLSREKFNKNLEVLIENCDCNISFIKLKIGDPDDIKSKLKFDKIVNRRSYGTSVNSFSKSLKLF